MTSEVQASLQIKSVSELIESDEGNFQLGYYKLLNLFFQKRKYIHVSKFG